jgi:predicted DNA-binding transcriptional regulator YafY
LIAYCHFRQAMRMFSAVRIRTARETGETFRPPADFKIDGYLGASFRALRGSGRHRVLLRFTPAAAGRAGEKVWHKSQTTEPQPDGSLHVGMELSDLREVQRWILSWGSECQVLEPEELRKSVRSEAEAILVGGGQVARKKSATREERVGGPTIGSQKRVPR